MAKDKTQTEGAPKQKKVSDIKCCLCGHYVTMSGFCQQCQRWPINVTPIRWCERGHRVDVSGFCQECKAYATTELLPAKGEWTDTNVIPKLLPLVENQQRMRDLVDSLAEHMSRARIMPVREDCAPAWLKRSGVVVGTTLMGYRILGPPTGAQGRDRPEFPICWEAHVEHLERGGLSHAAAQMQAFSLVHEPEHRRLCSITPAPQGRQETIPPLV